jgi:hypothetical protein
VVIDAPRAATTTPLPTLPHKVPEGGREQTESVAALCINLIETCFSARHRRNSGEISRGRISGISGQTMIAASTSSIGTSMIIVSLSA